LFQLDDEENQDECKLEVALDKVVYNIKQDIPVSSVQDIKQDDLIQDDEDIGSSVYDFKQIHFAVTVASDGKPRRTTTMLDGYLVKALQRKHGLSDNTAIRIWIEQAIKNDGRFNSLQPLTRQIKRIIIESFV
jgi:hypothetical protein